MAEVEKAAGIRKFFIISLFFDEKLFKFLLHPTRNYKLKFSIVFATIKIFADEIYGQRATRNMRERI